MIDTKQAIQELESIQNLNELEARQEANLGKKSRLQEQFKNFGSLAPEEKKTKGAELSQIKNELTQAYETKNEELSLAQINEQLQNDIIDVTIHTNPALTGHYSLLTKTRRTIEDICYRMGFHIEYGEEVVTKFENFISVNIPLTHPATEMHDSIYLKQKDKDGESLLFRTHTSAMQNKLIKKYGLPCQVVVPGKVYRNENTDATHDTTFYQLEGIYVNKNVTIGHMKQLMHDIIQALLGDKKIETRMRPAYFPFTEPGVEIDARYEITDEQGNTSRSKWMEIVGAGMIHPNVLTQAGVDPTKYSGFAFGFGINRLVAVQYGIKDIRLFTNGDLRFVRSF